MSFFGLCATKMVSLLFSVYLHEKNKGAILKTVNEEADAELFGR